MSELCHVIMTQVISILWYDAPNYHKKNVEKSLVNEELALFIII